MMMPDNIESYFQDQPKDPTNKSRYIAPQQDKHSEHYKSLLQLNDPPVGYVLHGSRDEHPADTLKASDLSISPASVLLAGVSTWAAATGAGLHFAFAWKTCGQGLPHP